MPATETDVTTQTSTVALSPSSSPPTGRLAVMTAYAVAATTIPIPFVPDRVLVRDPRGGGPRRRRPSRAEPDDRRPRRPRGARLGVPHAPRPGRRGPRAPAPPPPPPARRDRAAPPAASRSTRSACSSIATCADVRATSAAAHAPGGGAPRPRRDRPGHPPRPLAVAPARADHVERGHGGSARRVHALDRRGAPHERGAPELPGAAARVGVRRGRRARRPGSRMSEVDAPGATGETPGPAGDG